MSVKVTRFPPAPHKRFSSIGFGIMISNDNQFQGVSILLAFWQFRIGFFEAFLILLLMVIALIGGLIR